MRNYRGILKILLIDMFRRREKKHIALYVALGVLYLIVAAAGVAMLAVLAPIFVEGGKQAELVTALLFGDFLLTIVLGLVAAISFLYLSKDNEFFLSLPIKPQSVFLAKLTMVYITELIVSAGVLLPALITAGVAMSLPALFFILIPVIILFVPLFALIFISIISMPLVYFITLFRNRGAVTTIIVITLFSVAMAAYFYFVFSAQTSHISDETAVADFTPLFNIVTGLSYAFFPFYMLVKFATFSHIGTVLLPLSMAIELTLFLVSAVIAALISYFVTLSFYNRVNSKVLERGTSKSKVRAFVQSTPFKTFLKKEFKEVVRNPSVALQALAGIILCPLVVIMVSVSMSGTFGSIDELKGAAESIFWCMGIMMLLSVGVAGNAGANFCISREGANFYYLKMLPAPYSLQIKAKQTMYVLCGFCSTGLAVVALSITAAIKGAFVWWIPLLTLASAFSWVYAIVCAAIYMDLKNPRLDYKSIKEIIRRGKNSAVTIIWTFGSIIFSAIILVCCMVFVDRALIILATGLAVYAISGPMCAVLFHKKLYNNVEKLFEKLDV